jgi:membrane protein YdbS with pleckstrin-like domain
MRGDDDRVMNPFPLLPVFVFSVVPVILAIVVIFATQSWWAVAGAFVVLLAMSAVVGIELRETLDN